LPKLSNEEFSALFTKLVASIDKTKTGAAGSAYDVGCARYGHVFGNAWILISFEMDLEQGKVKTWTEWLSKEKATAQEAGDRVHAYILERMSQGWKYIGPTPHGMQGWQDVPDLWLDLDGQKQGTGKPLKEVANLGDS